MYAPGMRRTVGVDEISQLLVVAALLTTSVEKVSVLAELKTI